MQLFKKEIPQTARDAFPRESLPPSTIKLIEALELENENRQLDGIIDLAMRQYWHDFDSEVEMPKAALARLLISFQRSSLAQRVADGEFDSDSSEAEFWFQKNKDKIENMVKAVGGEEKMERVMREYFALAGRLDSESMNRIFQRIVDYKSKKRGRRWGKRKF